MRPILEPLVACRIAHDLHQHERLAAANPLGNIESHLAVG